MDDRSEQPRVLDYSPPPGPVGRTVNRITAVLGLLLALASGLFGLLMLIFGVPYLVDVLPKGNRLSPAFGEDVFESVMFIIIGLFCIYVAVRWIRSSVKALKRAGT